MDEKQLNKAIGYAILVIVAYHLLGFLIPMLTYGVIGLVLIRIIHAYLDHKR